MSNFIEHLCFPIPHLDFIICLLWHVSHTSVPYKYRNSKPYYKHIICILKKRIDHQSPYKEKQMTIKFKNKAQSRASPETIDDPTSEQRNVFHRQKKATVEHQKVKTMTAAMANRAPPRLCQRLHPERMMMTLVTMPVLKARVLDKGKISLLRSFRLLIPVSSNSALYRLIWNSVSNLQVTPAFPRFPCLSKDVNNTH